MNMTIRFPVHRHSSQNDKARLRPLVRIMLNMIVRLLVDKMEFERASTTLRCGSSKQAFGFFLSREPKSTDEENLQTSSSGYDR